MGFSWQIISDVLILLTAALLLGTLAEQLRQSAILGYLLAGTVVGPNVLGLVGTGEEVEVIADLGAALLLFTIGLEFSVRRLRHLGAVALISGSLQVVITMLAAATVAKLMGLDLYSSLAMGSIIALSSTACVLRLLVDRAALDSIYGRNALGFLLVQDVAVIPLILMITALGGGDSFNNAGSNPLHSVLLAGVLIGLFYVLFNHVVPRLLNIRHWVKNRDLPILLAIVAALGAVVAGRQVGISPAMAAFIAGVLLGGSPFAVQIRADVSPVRTLLVTVFFASIGLLGDPGLMMDRWIAVATMVTAIVVGKVFITSVILRAMRLADGPAVATGLCLAQVGEFSFVLAVIARDQLFGDNLFQLIISAMIVTLLLTPFLVAAAPHVTNWIETRRYRRDQRQPSSDDLHGSDEPQNRIFIIGFGPAGQCVARALLRCHREQIVVIDLNSRNITVAQGYGLAVQLGDASRREVLEHAQIHHACVIVITVPDPNSSRTMIHQCKYLAPRAAIVARARYHVLRWDLQLAGAWNVVDEEENVGLSLADQAHKHLHIDAEN